MHRRLAWMPALLATLPFAAFASSSVVHDRAEVRQLGTGRLLYRESHSWPDDSTRDRYPQVRIAFSPRPETASTDELARMQREPLSGRCAF